MSNVNSRRNVLGRAGALALGAAAWPLLAACGKDKPPAKVVGWLWDRPPEASDANLAAFFSRLAQLGYVLGEDLKWDYEGVRIDESVTAIPGRDAFSQIGEQYHTRVRQMLERNASAILALDSAAVAAGASIRVPVIFLQAVAAADPVGTGLVATYAEPGRNVTGITTVIPVQSLWPKRLELLKEALPNARRVGFFANASNVALPVVISAAGPLGLDLVPLEVPVPTDWQALLANASGQRLQAVVVAMQGALANDPRFYDFADEQRLPAVGDVRGRATLYYAFNEPAVYRRLAEMLDVVLRGTDPRSIPVERPTKFDFVIDLARARSFGLSVSPSALALATEVVQ